jgi:hypothetical protein
MRPKDDITEDAKREKYLSKLRKRDQMKKWAIYFENKVTGEISHGEFVHDESEAKQICEMMNLENNFYTHWAVQETK